MYAHKNLRCNRSATRDVKTTIGASMTNISDFGYTCPATGQGTMPRTGEPKEVAKLALFLGSDDASFINGQSIAADAGWTAY
ncbi:SDR family oxidoreductase [Kurthia massiliensis]|uniref:SDR family oxidoreductase n=1 Tax=Kurthia massiliensis TaxID=1033739 RepID=UPI000A07314B|nr:SDR family oxidoreductase [Kurthia massiliensis]